MSRLPLTSAFGLGSGGPASAPAGRLRLRGRFLGSLILQAGAIGERFHRDAKPPGKLERSLPVRLAAVLKANARALWTWTPAALRHAARAHLARYNHGGSDMPAPWMLCRATPRADPKREAGR